MRVRLNIAYDGSAFRGWQVQPGERTVQGEIERALAALFRGEPVRIMGSGRTDTGVHAVGQVAHFEAPFPRDPAEIARALDGMLPEAIRVWRVREVDHDFHARFQARQREYGYRILATHDIFSRRHGWWPGERFELDIARDLSREFPGERDFRAFATKPEPGESTVCDLRAMEWREVPGGWVVHVVADRFLRRMVRTLVGTVADVARGLREAAEVRALLAGEKGRAGTPAPPEGLALLRVHYDDDDEGDNPPPSPWRFDG